MSQVWYPPLPCESEALLRELYDERPPVEPTLVPLGVELRFDTLAVHPAGIHRIELGRE